MHFLHPILNEAGFSVRIHPQNNLKHIEDCEIRKWWVSDPLKQLFTQGKKMAFTVHQSVPKCAMQRPKQAVFITFKALNTKGHGSYYACDYIIEFSNL